MASTTSVARQKTTMTARTTRGIYKTPSRRTTNGSGSMPTDGPAIPDPKARTLARGQRRYRRHVASPKQWAAIQAAKLGPCRICGTVGRNGRVFGRIQLHHVVSREDFGDDVAENIVPLCPECHDTVTRRVPQACRALLMTLRDEEYAYMIERGGEGYPERAYGVEYER